MYASVTAGTVCPAAIYVVRTIYNHTNNAVFKQYIPKKNAFTFIKIFCFYNCICIYTHP